MRNPFRKDIEPRCAYCAHGSAVNEREVACSRRGVVDGATTAATSATTLCAACRRGPPRSIPKRTLPEDFPSESYIKMKREGRIMEIKTVYAVYFSATGRTRKVVTTLANAIAQTLELPLETVDFTLPCPRGRRPMPSRTRTS